MALVGNDAQLRDFREVVRGHFGAAIFNDCFDGLRLEAFADGEVTLCVDNRDAAESIAERYAKDFNDLWSEFYGRDDLIKIKSKWPSSAETFYVTLDGASMAQNDNERSARAAAALMATGPAEISADKGEYVVAGESLSAPLVAHKRELTFENFCVNDTNRIAFTAVGRLLEGAGGPSITYVYGASGRGKSHLLQAASAEFMRRSPDKKMIYLSYESLISDISDAFTSQSIKEYRRHLQDTDFLIFDDVQLLRGRKRTMEELACLLERMVQLGRPVLIAGTMSPVDLVNTGILQRLTDRLGGGLSVNIGSPDFELRLSIANRRAEMFRQQTGLSIPQRHVDYVARHCEQSVRNLEGAMSSLELAIESRGGMPLSDEERRMLLKDQVRTVRSEASLERIFAYAAEKFDVAPGDLRGKGRRRPIVRARQAFCLAARKLTDAPLSGIGAMINRDHTTVMHSIRQAEIFAESDLQFGNRISDILEQFDQ